MKTRHVRHGWGAAAVLLATVLMAFAAAAARAGSTPEMSGLYQATAIVTGSDTRYRSSGFARCLREVLVKLSGEPRLESDPRTAVLAAHADALVASFYYMDPKSVIPHRDDQASYDRSHYLTVDFDPARIDRALARLGLRPWRGERPVLVPALRVRGVAGNYWLSAETSAAAEQRVAFATVAGGYGMKARIPSEAELAAWGVTMGWFPPPQVASAPDQVIVVGTLEFQPALPGWVGSWRMFWKGEGYAWSISGVNYDGAFRDLIRGAVRVVSGHGAPDS